MNAAQSLATVPLLDGEWRAGAIGWTFSGPQRFDEEQQVKFIAMANECMAMLADQITAPNNDQGDRQK